MTFDEESHEIKHMPGKRSQSIPSDFLINNNEDEIKIHPQWNALY